MRALPGKTPSKEPFIQIMQACWIEAGININLSPEEESQFEALFDQLFGSRMATFNGRVAELGTKRLSGILAKKLEGQWKSSVPAGDINSIQLVASETEAETHIIAAEWVIQKTILMLMKERFDLEKQDEFNAIKETRGYIALSMRGSIVIAGKPTNRNVTLKQKYSKRYEIEDGQITLPLRHHIYFRMPSRRMDEFLERREGLDCIFRPITVGESWQSSGAIERVNRGPSQLIDLSRTSIIRELLAIPEEKLAHMGSIINASSMIASVNGQTQW